MCESSDIGGLCAISGVETAERASMQFTLGLSEDSVFFVSDFHTAVGHDQFERGP